MVSSLARAIVAAITSDSSVDSGGNGLKRFTGKPREGVGDEAIAELTLLSWFHVVRTMTLALTELDRS
jgi:hypothetical protein